MANNRLQIYCVECLGMKCINKYYPVDWSFPDDVGMHINTFLEEHLDCFLKSKELGVGTNMFKFRTECDDDGFISDYSKRPYKLITNNK